MLRPLLALTALAALVVVDPAPAEAQAYDDSYQTWASLTVQGNVTPDLVLYIDMNWRFWDDFDPYQQLYRPGLGYRIAEGMHVWLAYAWTPAWDRQGRFTDEHRVWEQWTYDVPNLPDGMKVLVRSRLEQRFRPEISSDVGVRFRQFVRLLVPFAPDFPLHLSLWDEAFIALNDAGLSAGGLWQRLGFDQNRLFLGIGWNAIPGTFRIEAGYLNHWIVRATSQDEVHHTLAVNAFLSFR